MLPDNGVHNPQVVDLCARNPDGSVLLVMQEHRPWDGSDQRLRELQDKVNAYLCFALDGQMQREYPGVGTKGLVLQLDCVEPPDETVRALVPPLRAALAPLGIEFQVQVRGAAGLWNDPGGAPGHGVSR